MDLGISIETIRMILVAIPGILLAVCYHEAAHAWMADRCGDPTARMLGRVSANPIRHIDPIGTILVPIGLYVLSNGQFLFGWAKPVPIVPRNFRKLKRDMVLTALAGPTTNFIMALLCASVYHLLALVPSGSMAEWIEPVKLAAQAAVFINVLLGVFNLVPIPPLDGGRVAVGLLPPRPSIALARLERFGILIVIALLWLPPTRLAFGLALGMIEIAVLYVIPSLGPVFLVLLAQIFHGLL